jgi:hypothetical protein
MMVTNTVRVVSSPTEFVTAIPHKQPRWRPCRGSTSPDLAALGAVSHSCPAVALAAILACDYAERIFPLQFEPRDQFEQRQKKLQQIQALGLNAYPHEFRWTDTAAKLAAQFGATPGADLEANRREVRVAGRIVSLRLMGKAGFAHLQGAG